MHNFRSQGGDFSFCGQIAVADVHELAAMGSRSSVCLTPWGAAASPPAIATTGRPVRGNTRVRPLAVERGNIVHAKFLYGDKVAPSFPKWLIDGTRPSRTAWVLKERVLPPLYWAPC